MNRFIQPILIKAALVLVLGVSAASLSSAAHANKLAIEQTNYAMHIDQIGPAASIGESTVAMKIKLQAHRSPSFSSYERW